MPRFTGKGLFKLFREPSLFNTPAPQTATTSATLTTDQLLGEVLQALPEGAEAVYTTPTGMEISAALAGVVNVGDSFDLWIINTETDPNGNIVLAMGSTGVTLIGNNDIEEEDNIANSSSAHFRFRNTDVDTWDCMRLA